MELVARPQGQAVVSNLETVILMKPQPAEIEDIARQFRLSEQQKAFIASCGVGEALLRVGSEVAAVKVEVADFESDVMLGKV